MFPQLDETPTVFDDLREANKENIRLKNKNEQLRKEIDKHNLFKDMLKDLITRHFGVKEFNKNSTIYGCLEDGINELKMQKSLVACVDCACGVTEEAEAEHINENLPRKN